MKRIAVTLTVLALALCTLWAVTTEIIVINATPLIPASIGTDVSGRVFMFSGRKGTTNNTGTVWIQQNTNEVGLPLLPGQRIGITVGAAPRMRDFFIKVATTNDGATINIYQ